MLKLRDIMTADLVTVTPDTTLREAAEVLAGHHLSGVPVTSGTHVAGVLTANDLLTFDASRPPVPTERETDLGWGDFLETTAADDVERGDEAPGAYWTELWDDAGAEVTARISATEGPEWNVLDEHTVEEVMTREVVSMRADEPVDAAADLMRRMGVHRVLVMEEDALVGIVTTMDIAKAVADHQLRTRTYVFPGRQPW